MGTQTCPRRIEQGRADPTSPLVGSGEGLDDWASRRGLIGQARGCTYCGSMHPDDFMQAVRDGKEIGPTDKSYKVYVDQMTGKFYLQHLTEEQRQEFIELHNSRQMRVGYPGYFYVAPFFTTRSGQ